MDIVFNIDNGYAQHVCVTILSILSTNQKASIRFHILSCNLSEENQNYISQLVQVKGSDVVFYCKDASEIRDFPVGKTTCNARLTSAAYLRLFIPELLPDSVHKVLYLDSDIVVTASLEELWNQPLDSYCVAAADDCWPFVIEEAQRLGLPQGTRYFNSGVMLLNLDNLRNKSFVELAQQYAIQNAGRILYHDQDVLNALLFDSRLTLPSQWNQMEEQAPIIAPIVHFAGRFKPWHIECTHPQKTIYYSYLQDTKWCGYRQVYYHGPFKRFKLFVRGVFNKLR